MNEKAVKPLVVTVAALGAVAVLLLASRGFEGPVSSTVLFAVLAVLAGFRPVRIPGAPCRINATQPLILAALGVAGPATAGLVAIVGVAASALGSRPRPATLKLAFNVGAVSVSVGLASACFLALGGRPGGGLSELLFPVAAGAAVYFVANTGLLAAVVSAAERLEFARTWSKTFLWTIPSNLTGLSVASAVIAVWDSSVPWAVFLILPPCWLLVKHYRQRAPDSETRAAIP